MSETERRGLVIPVTRDCYVSMMNTIKRQRLELAFWRITGLVLIVFNLVGIFLAVKG